MSYTLDHWLGPRIKGLAPSLQSACKLVELWGWKWRERSHALLFVNETPPSALSCLTETEECFIRCPTNTRSLKITEENVLPLLSDLQVAKLSLIRTKNLRPPLTAFYSSPTVLERLRCTRYIKGHFMHFIVLSTKKGLKREQTSWIKMHKMTRNRLGNLTGKDNESRNLSEVSLFLFKSFHFRRLQKQSFHLDSPYKS